MVLLFKQKKKSNKCILKWTKKVQEFHTKNEGSKQILEGGRGGFFFLKETTNCKIWKFYLGIKEKKFLEFTRFSSFPKIGEKMEFSEWTESPLVIKWQGPQVDSIITLCMIIKKRTVITQHYQFAGRKTVGLPMNPWGAYGIHWSGYGGWTWA